MRRNDPLLQPICHICGKYKGVGPCSNPKCQESIGKSGVMTKPITKKIANRELCAICEKDAVLSCYRCNLGFCEIHGTAQAEEYLVIFDQRVGTCSICKQIVCENCWIFEGDGNITCLAHHEQGHRHNEK
ncbi:MAG: hypothetical protein ACFFDM_04725 [Candidatus Thorarchaeota archaeon]